MATDLKNLSEFDPAGIPSPKDMKFGIVVSEWNAEITNALLQGTTDTLKRLGTKPENTHLVKVPGSFEIPFAARQLAEAFKPDAVICLGCVIQGETRHFDYICQGVTQGITELNLKYNIPFIFGILTTQNIEQARERAGGKFGNKGEEAAVTAIRIVHLKREMLKYKGKRW